MRAFSYAVVVVILMAGECRNFAGDADDVKKLQGVWEVAELVAYGKKVDLKEIKGTKFIFAGSMLTIQPPNDKLEEFAKRTFTFKLNGAKKPAEVDLTMLDEKKKPITSPGIYELKDDTLRWCQSDGLDAPQRPKEFSSPENSPIYLFTLQREKKK